MANTTQVSEADLYNFLETWSSNILRSLIHYLIFLIYLLF